MEGIGSATLFVGICFFVALAISTLEDWLFFRGPNALASFERLQSLPQVVQLELLKFSPCITNRLVKKTLKYHARTSGND